MRGGFRIARSRSVGLFVGISYRRVLQRRRLLRRRRAIRTLSNLIASIPATDLRRTKAMPHRNICTRYASWVHSRYTAGVFGLYAKRSAWIPFRNAFLNDFGF